MRTPDGEDEGTQAPGADPNSGSLAEGFAQAESGGGGEGDDAFGSGWPGQADGGGTGGEETQVDGSELFATGGGDDSGGDGESGDGLGPEDPYGADGAFAPDGFGADESSFSEAQEDMAAFDGGEMSAFEFDSENVADGEDNLDFDGNGTTDAGDGPAAIHGLHSFDEFGD